MGIFCKKVWNLYKKEKNTQKTEEQKKFYAELIAEIRKEHEYSNESDKVIQGQVDTLRGDLSILKEGILSLQGKEFKKQCRALLEAEHHITLDEFEELSIEHDRYNALGGNHKGDELFELAKKKFEASL